MSLDKSITCPITTLAYSSSIYASCHIFTNVVDCLIAFLILSCFCKIIFNVSTGASSTLKSDRKSTRLNSSHVAISYAVFCLKKKKLKKEIEKRQEKQFIDEQKKKEIDQRLND